jgi:hypothetical protein
LGEHRLGDKRSAYEESMRVPMLVRYPKLGAKEKLVDTAVLNIDIAPTILDLAGVSVPAPMQGRSWRPLLEGKAADWRRAFFYCYYFERGFRTPTMMAVRDERTKLVKYPGHEEWTELFDLQADPYEMKNLIRDPAHAEQRRHMEAEYDAQARTIGFQVPRFADQAADGPPAPAPAAKECVLDYRFDRDAGEKTLDRSGHENHASAGGAPLVAGRDGHKARHFDGTVSIEVSKATSLSPSMSAWTATVAFKAEKPDGTLLTHGGASQGYCLYLKEGKPTWTVRTSKHAVTVAGSKPLAEGWHTLAGVITADKQIVLVCDGKQVGKGKLHDLIPKDPNQGLRIGVNRGSQVISGDPLPGFTGLIESVQIFNHERP